MFLTRSLHARALSVIPAIDGESAMDVVDPLGLRLQQQQLTTDEKQAAVEKKYEYLLYQQDGAANPLKAIIDICVPRAERYFRTQKKRIYAKSGGGCSMTQSANARGCQHPIIPAGYRHPKFKYDKIWADPDGAGYQGVKEIMKANMKPGDFGTLWKGLAAADDITSKALTLHNCKGAFNSLGIVTVQGVMNVQAGLTNDPSDALEILSGNAHFHYLPTAEATAVLALVADPLSEIFGQHSMILSDEFERLLAPIANADNTPPVKAGNKKIDEMAISRYYFCLFEPELFNFRQSRIDEREREAALKALAKNQRKEHGTGKRGGGAEDDDGEMTKKKRKQARCSNNSCMAEMEDNGTKCDNTGCRFRFCSTCLVSAFYLTHKGQCQLVQQQKKQAKAGSS